MKRTRAQKKVVAVNGLAHHDATEIQEGIDCIIEDKEIYHYLLESMTTVSNDMILMTFELKRTQTKAQKKVVVVNGLANQTQNIMEIQNNIDTIIAEKENCHYILESMTTVSEDMIFMTFKLQNADN